MGFGEKIRRGADAGAAHLLEREAPDFSSCRYLDRVRVRDDPSPKAMPTAYPFGEATKIRPGERPAARPLTCL